MTICPSSDELYCWLEAGPEADPDGQLAAHLETCACCQQELERLTALGGTSELGARNAERGAEDSSEFRVPSTEYRVPREPARTLAVDLNPLRCLLHKGPLEHERTTGAGGGWANSPGFPPGWPVLPGYEIEAELGQGGMGIVFRARQVRLNRLVAVKMIRADHAITPEQRVRFGVEGETVARLHHPNVVQIHEVGVQQERPYLVLEFVAGGTLQARCSGRPQPARLAARLVEPLAQAIEHAHQQGIVHRDLKPANVLLAGGPDTPLEQCLPKITDFGLARLLDTDLRLTQTGAVAGTPSYMAPEQARPGAQAVGPAADVYALGVILYELLTGRPPFLAATALEVLRQVVESDPLRPSRLVPRVPRDLETICLKCLRKEPGQRYASAGALAEDLRRFLEGKSVRARPVGTLERAARWCRRNPALAAVTAGCVLALGLGSAGVFWKWREAETEKRNAVGARNESQRLLAEMRLDKGIGLAEQGEVSEGLLWMLEALKSVPEKTPDLERVIRTNLAAWMGQTHRLGQLVGHPNSVRSCVFTADGKHLITGSHAGLRFWDPVTGSPLGSPLAVRADGALAVSPDGQMLTLADNVLLKVQRWDVQTRKPIGPPLPHPGPVWTIAFTPDGKQFATGCVDGTVRLWDARSGELVSDVFKHKGLVLFALQFSPDGKTLAVGTGQWDVAVPGAVRLWNLATGKQMAGSLHHGCAVECLAYSPDGARLLTGSWDQTAQLWDVTTRQRLGKPLRHPHYVRAVRFAPDGRTFVTSGYDGIVRWWDSQGSQLIGLPSRGLAVFNLAFSPDGKQLAVASGWDVVGGELCLYQLARDWSHPPLRIQDPIRKMAWRPEDAAMGETLVRLAHSPDARRVLTGGAGSMPSCGMRPPASRWVRRCPSRGGKSRWWPSARMGACLSWSARIPTRSPRRAACSSGNRPAGRKQVRRNRPSPWGRPGRMVAGSRPWHLARTARSWPPATRGGWFSSGMPARANGSAWDCASPTKSGAWPSAPMGKPWRWHTANGTIPARTASSFWTWPAENRLANRCRGSVAGSVSSPTANAW